jgi:hypothetical protein
MTPIPTPMIPTRVMKARGDTEGAGDDDLLPQPQEWMAAIAIAGAEAIAVLYNYRLHCNCLPRRYFPQ